MNWHTVKEIVIDILFDIAGSAFLAIGIQMFNAPNNIAPGGVTGISILINHLTGLPISVLNFAINVPLLILAFLFLGRSFTVKTLKSVVVFTVVLSFIEAYIPPYHGEMILVVLYGGVLSGLGLGLVFMRSSTTGGSDIVVRLAQKRAPGISIGKLMLIFDGCVLICAAIVYRNLDSALYALICIFASSRMVDGILYGLDVGKVLMIISERHAELPALIHQHLGRGCTILEGRGSFTEIDRPVLLSAVRKSQYYELKRIIHQLDPHAFMVVLEAGEILGEGFKSISE